MRCLSVVALPFLTLWTIGLFATSTPAQSREERVRNDKTKVEAAGYWLYNDFPAAMAEVKRTGKPIMAVLRCLPCVECVKLDDDLIDADERVRPLLDQYVRVRIVSTNGLDLSLFQFDTDQSFAMFMLNADGTVYGRFGTRSHRTNWVGDVSVNGMAKALAGGLALHKGYPANKAELAAKRGPKPEFASPEKFPSLADKYQSKLDYDGKVVQSCIHCHMIGDALRELSLSRDKTLPEELLFPYPHPKTVGLVLDPKEMALVLEVTPGSDAERAGFNPGDAIQKLAGQPLVSMADVQWVLHNTSPGGDRLRADIVRGGEHKQLSLELPAGWRHRDDIAWRASTWGLRRAALGGAYLVDLPKDQREQSKLPVDSMALLVEHVGEYPPHDVAKRAGLRKGDIVVAFNGRSDLRRETDAIAWSIQKRAPGEPVKLTVLRGGKPQTIEMPLVH